MYKEKYVKYKTKYINITKHNVRTKSLAGGGDFEATLSGADFKKFEENKSMLGSKDVKLEMLSNPIKLNQTVDSISFNLFGCWNSKSFDTMLNNQYKKMEKTKKKDEPEMDIEPKKEGLEKKDKQKKGKKDEPKIGDESKKESPEKKDKPEKYKISYEDIDSYADSSTIHVLSDMMKNFNVKLAPTFAITTGDNYYNKFDGHEAVGIPEDTRKTINIDTGFANFDELKIPHFISMGNHDVEDKNVFLHEFKKSYTDMTKDVADKTITFGNWILPSTCYAVQMETKNKEDKALFIFVDTNMFMIGESSGSFKSDKHILYPSPFEIEDKKMAELNPEENKQMAYIKEKQGSILAWIEEKITETGDKMPIMVVGHHPFYCIGHKAKRPFLNNVCDDDGKDGKGGKDSKGGKDGKDSKGGKDGEDKGSGNHLKKLYDILINNGVKFYLCADEHNFQYIYDHINDFHQIISGGASSGDEIESYNYVKPPAPYDTRGIRLQTLDANMPSETYVKFMLSSPHYVHFQVSNSRIEFKVISITTNSYHQKDLLSSHCEPNYHKGIKYGVSYSCYIPRYSDHIMIIDCNKYMTRKEKEPLVEAVNKASNKVKKATELLNIVREANKSREIIDEAETSLEKAKAALVKAKNAKRIFEETRENNVSALTSASTPSALKDKDLSAFTLEPEALKAKDVSALTLESQPKARDVSALTLESPPKEGGGDRYKMKHLNYNPK